MSACDLCGCSLENQGNPFTQFQMRKAADRGLGPRGNLEAIGAIMGLSDQQIRDTWRRDALETTARWTLCDACASEVMALQPQSSGYVEFACTGCHAKIRISGRHAGRTGKCKKCGATMRIPVAGFDATMKADPASPPADSLQAGSLGEVAAEEPAVVSSPARTVPEAQPGRLPGTKTSAEGAEGSSQRAPSPKVFWIAGGSVAAVVGILLGVYLFSSLAGAGLTTRRGSVETKPVLAMKPEDAEADRQPKGGRSTPMQRLVPAGPIRPEHAWVAEPGSGRSATLPAGGGPGTQPAEDSSAAGAAARSATIPASSTQPSQKEASDEPSGGGAAANGPDRQASNLQKKVLFTLQPLTADKTRMEGKVQAIMTEGNEGNITIFATDFRYNLQREHSRHRIALVQTAWSERAERRACLHRQPGGLALQ